jgi:hypothetical protein
MLEQLLMKCPQTSLSAKLKKLYLDCAAEIIVNGHDTGLLSGESDG